MSRKVFLFLTVIVLFAMILSACGSDAPTAAPPVEDTTQNDAAEPEAEDKGNEPAPENEANDMEESEEEPVEEPTVSDFTPLPAERQSIEITSSGNRKLEGWYYPAKVDNAPVVVLMHWAIGTMEDWQVIAPWMQNRLDEVTLPQAGEEAYYDIIWFPAMPEDISYAVVVFNFGDFGDSEFGGDRESWLWDAIAALQFASQLEGIDKDRISALGASIGSDGSVDSCYLFNDAGEMGTCIGALSLSPGNYLTENFVYLEAAMQVDMGGYPVWCLAAENDYESPALCKSLVGDNVRSFIFAGADHGMALVTPNHSPMEPALPEINTMMIILEWLEVTYGVTHNKYSIP